MSDRRAVVAVVGSLVALLGAAMVLLPMLELGDPVVPSGELGTPTDITRELVGTMAVGALLVIGGITTVAALVVAQLRRS